VQGVKYRNMLAQVGLMIITIGIYGIYWFYQTSEEMKFLAKDDKASPALWTVLLFIPFGAFYSIYKHSEIYQKISSDSLNMWILFLLWIVFSPAVWFIVQTELNKKATIGKPAAV
jgi:cytochrome bd-type quinol oxidase subunit 2